MRRPIEHVIDSKAQSILSGALPKEWVINPYPLDYGKDYIIEVFEDSRPTGEMFHIQLKGTREVKMLKSKAAISFPMKISHLKYYREVVREPVFLVVADTHNKTAHFLFLQEYLDNNLRSRSWKNTTASVHIPLCNDVTDKRNLIQAVRTAASYMRDKYPGSPAASVKAEKERLDKADPRFRHEVSASKKGTHIVVHAKEDVNLEIKISGRPEIVREKMSNLIEKGLPIDTKELDIDIIGSPTFSCNGEKPSVIQFNHAIPFEMTLGLKDSCGNRIAALPTYIDELCGGTKEQYFNGLMKNNPFEISVCISGNHQKPKLGVMDCKFQWKPEKWYGQPIRFLPYLEQINEFVNQLKDAHKMFLSCTSQGSKIINSEQVVSAELNRLSRIEPYLALLTQCNLIAKTFGINPHVPVRFSDTDIDDIEELYALATTGSHTRENERCSFAFTHTKQLPLEDQIKEQPGTLTQISTDITYEFLDTKFTVPHWQVEYRCGKLVNLGRNEDGQGYRARIENAVRTITLPHLRVD